MKEVLSVFTFGIGAVCFMVFFTVLKPHAFSAVAGPSKPDYCNTQTIYPLSHIEQNTRAESDSTNLEMLRTRQTESRQ
jgi:hypothetical protein